MMFLRCVVVVLAVGTCHNLFAIAVYWTDNLGAPRGGPPREDNVQRSTPLGHVPEVVIPNLGNPQDVELDLLNGKVYWTDDLLQKIQRANLDGTGVEDVIVDAAGVKGLALDIPGGKLYWVDNGFS